MGFDLSKGKEPGMGKYPISKEFGIFAHFVPPIPGPGIAGWMGGLMRPPGWFWKDPEIKACRRRIPGCGGDDIEVILAEPRGVETDRCLVYFHGGGFFFGAAGLHYALVKRYALETPCKVVFADYRRTPKHPFPVPAEDCYAAFRWTVENAEELGVAPEKIAVGGDSAGGCLCAAVTLMARDRMRRKPCFQMLIYPVTDRRMDSDSYRRFSDTPMWNAPLSGIMFRGYLPEGWAGKIGYASPAEAEDHSGLPDAYVEAAEFDCLHDDAVSYAGILRRAGVPVEFYETRGTMHGFDIVRAAPTTQAAVARRVNFMRQAFRKAEG